MPRNLRLAILKCSVAIGLCLALCVAVAGAGHRVRFAPKFFAGQTLRYRIESRTMTTGQTTTPIANPEGGTQASLLIHVLVRLDVLDAPQAGATRIRATYEKSSAESDSDAYDPGQPSLADRYAQLEGHSIEFALEPGGRLGDVKGLDDILPDASAAQSAMSWLRGLSTGGFPRDGVQVGQKWRGERAFQGAPLAGLSWRVESTYLRDEPCNAPGAPAASDSCAVILSHFEISRAGSPHADATPEDYRRNGLRVSGAWTGSGEGLDSISLSSGLLIRSTQTTDQQMDYQIASTSTGSSIRRKGQVHAQSEITLVPATAAGSS